MILRAQTRDAAQLCKIAISAFHEDRRYRHEGVIPDGPPGHDQVAKHVEWIEENFYAKYVTESGTIAGGCIAEIQHTRGFIHGLFVDADSMNKGIGQGLVRFVIDSHPAVKRWSLQTPDYAIRNQYFYEKLGFVCRAESAVDPALGFGFLEYELFR